MSQSLPQLSPDILTSIARQFGTPVYVYDAACIDFQYRRLTHAFSRSGPRFFYACKSLTNLNVLKYICSLGAGLDCVSINEVKLGLMAGFKPDNIIFTPNCVGFDEYKAAADLGVHINIDSLSMLSQFGTHFGDRYPVCIRLNPHIMAGGNLKISTGHADSKFGISIQQLEEIRKIVAETKLTVTGLHIHTGSDIKDVDVFLEGLALLLRTASDFPSLQFLDLGSGFKVPYQEGDPQTDVALLGEKLADVLDEFAGRTGRRFEIWFEPGKFLVSQCGYFIVQANVVKATPARVFVGVDSGFNHLIRPMFYDAYHRIVNLSNPQGPIQTYTVVGNICETDTFAWDRQLNEVREGDLLLFFNAGAYGFEMSSHFNARFKPAEVMVLEGQPRLIRRRDTLEDLLRTQIPVL